MNLILLKNFNNYYNRKIIKYEDSVDYTSRYEYRTLININFVPNDGILTEQIVNWSEDFTPDYLVCEENGQIVSRWFVMEAVRTRSKQYKLSLRRDVVADNYDSLLTSPVYIEKGVISDSESPLLLNNEGLQVNQIKTKEILLQDKSKCPWLVAYLKKGMLGKKPLTDGINVKIPAAPGNFVQLGTKIDQWEYYKFSQLSGPNWKNMIVADNIKLRINSWYYQGSSSLKMYLKSITNAADCSTSTDWFTVWNSNKATNLWITSLPDPMWPRKSVTRVIKQAWQDYNPIDIMRYVYQDFEDWVSNSKFNELLRIVNIGRVRDSEGRYFKVSYKMHDTSAQYAVDSSKTNMYNIMSTVSKNALNYPRPTDGPNQYAFAIIPVNGSSVEILLTEELELNAVATFPSNETVTTDNPLYDIICMPYKEDGTITYYKDGVNYEVAGKLNLATMYSITTEGGGSEGYILDLQLLPYCPIQSVISDNGTILVNDADNAFIVSDSTHDFITCGFIVPKGDFTLDIDEKLTLERPFEDNVIHSNLLVSGTNTIERGRNVVIVPIRDDGEKGDYEVVNISVTSRDGREVYTVNNYIVTWLGITVNYRVPDYSAYIGEPSIINITLRKTVRIFYYYNTLIEDIKIANECDLYRLCSPNYNGAFDFNLMKNNKEVKKFNVDCQYKPYNPYIHVNPDFAGLYGRDFDDSRGLVCGGDFSIGIVNDQWNAYEIQNKNYQNIFNRQIQNMEVNNAIARQEAGWQAVAGTVQGAASGAAAGGAMSGGNPYAAAAGAVVGGTTAMVGGAMDLANLQKRQQEAKSFAIDNYNYSLQNIRALPASITKTSPITNNNKLFPFVEYYTCTDVEKTAFKNKIKYDGMSVGIIDTLENWVSGEAENYVKGHLIRLDTISEDNHLLEELNLELSKGVYL